MGATERVKEFIDYKGITKYQFCKDLGFSNKFLDNSSNMGTDKACKILHYFPDLNSEWLLTGNGEMIKTKSKENVTLKNSNNNSNIIGNKPNVKKIYSMETYNIGMVSDLDMEYQKVVQKIKFADGVSLVDEGAPFYPLPVSAGTVAELIQEEERPTGYVSIPGISCKAYFPVIGFSFGDIIPAGSIIGVDFINSWETLDPDCVYFIVTADQRMAKRLVADPDDPNNLICLSPNYQSFKISKDDIKVIHKVIFVGRPI